MVTQIDTDHRPLLGEIPGNTAPIVGGAKQTMEQ